MNYQNALVQYQVLLDAYEADPTLANYTAAQGFYDTVLVPTYQAAKAAYDAALAQYDLDVAAREALIAAWQAYPPQLASSRSWAIDTFLISCSTTSDMYPLMFTAAWAGPSGYWGALSTWLNTPGQPIPATVTDPHRWIGDRLRKANLSTGQWDAHVAGCADFDFRQQNPPAPLPEAPESPVPPQSLPEQPEPPVITPPTPATYRADALAYTKVATGVTTADARVLNKLWSIMQPGEIADLNKSHRFPRMDVKGVATRPAGGAPITFRSQPPNPFLERALILRNVPPSGGSNALFLGPGCSGAIFEELDLECDDTAAVMTASSPIRDFTWRRCRFFGYWDPVANAGLTDDSKWGLLLNDCGNWLLEDCEIFGIRGEHALYEHNRLGLMTWRRVSVKHCQRTAYQSVARSSEGALAVGDVLLEDCDIEDVCLESGGGGSAITCRGGQPTANWTLRRVKVRLGCNPALQAPFNQNITGAVVFDTGGGSHPGGTGTLTLDGCDFEVGSAHPGVSNARRSNVRLEDVGAVTIKDTRIVQGPGAHPIALEIAASVGSTRFFGTNTIIGQVKYQGTLYQTFAAFQAANPGLFA